MNRKVAIVGKAPTAVLAPFSDPAWEIWGLSWVTYPREDRTFDIHWPGVMPKNLIAVGDKKGIGVWGFPDGDYTHNIPFPFEAVRKEVSSYLESSISYMMALAILEGVEEIGLWGIHMEQSTEYGEQLPSLMYLIGLAEGRGIRVTICPGAPLFVSNWLSGSYGGPDSDRRF